MPDEFETWARRVVEHSLGPLSDAAIFVAIMSDNYTRDAVAVCQFGLAVLLNKPIYLLLPEGRSLNDNIVRLARAVEVYRAADDIALATERLLAKARADGVLAEP